MKNKLIAVAILSISAIVTNTTSAVAAENSEYKASVEAWKAANKAANDSYKASVESYKAGKQNYSTAKKAINEKFKTDAAASKAGVIVTVTTAVTGHKSLTASGKPSRHTTGNAVDIAIVNGVAVSNKQQIETEVNKFVAQLKALGYIINVESGKPKAVLTYGFANHDDHIHISNTLA